MRSPYPRRFNWVVSEAFWVTVDGRPRLPLLEHPTTAQLRSPVKGPGKGSWGCRGTWRRRALGRQATVGTTSTDWRGGAAQRRRHGLILEGMELRTPTSAGPRPTVGMILSVLDVDCCIAPPLHCCAFFVKRLPLERELRLEGGSHRHGKVTDTGLMRGLSQGGLKDFAHQ